MGSPYWPHRFRAKCVDGCAWGMTAWDSHVADGAARAHPMLQPGHTAISEPIPEEERQCLAEK